MSLERNQHIKLAHIKSDSFDQLEAKREPNTECTMWFIGLEFAKSPNLNVVLTHDIQQFTETVMNKANSIKMLKDGMRLEARHVRRKEVNQYLPPNYLKRERKLSVVKNGTATNENNKRPIDPLIDDGVIAVPTKKVRLSEEVRTNMHIFLRWSRSLN